MCPSISNILRPKTSDEISQTVIDMNTFEFISKFQNFNIKGLHINFRKKLAYFFIVTFKKYWNRVYWHIWSLWAITTLINLVLTSNKIEIPIVLIAIKYIALGFIYFALIPLTISLIYILKFRKWDQKNDNYNHVHINQDIIDRLREISERNEELLRNREHEVRIHMEEARRRARDYMRDVETRAAANLEEQRRRMEEYTRRMQEQIRRQLGGE